MVLPKYQQRPKNGVEYCIKNDSKEWSYQVNAYWIIYSHEAISKWEWLYRFQQHMKPTNSYLYFTRFFIQIVWISTDHRNKFSKNNITWDSSKLIGSDGRILVSLWNQSDNAFDLINWKRYWWNPISLCWDVFSIIVLAITAISYDCKDYYTSW